MNNQSSPDGPLAKRMAAIDKKMRDKKGKGTKPDQSKQSQVQICSIKNCNEPSIHSLSKEKYESVLKLLKLSVKNKKFRRVHVCKEHYKALRRQEKKEGKTVRPKFDKKGTQRAYNAKFMR